MKLRNKRICGLFLSGIFGAALLCGCAEQSEPKKPVPLERSSSLSDALSSVPAVSGENGSSSSSRSSRSGGSDTVTGYQTPDISQSIQSASSASSVNSSSSAPGSSSILSSSRISSSSGGSSLAVSRSSSAVKSVIISSAVSILSSSESDPEPVIVSSSESTVSSSVSTEERNDPAPILTNGASLLDGYTSKWAYNHIPASLKPVYERIYSCVEGGGETVNIYDLGITSEDDMRSVYYAFDYDNPQFLKLGSGIKYDMLDIGAGMFVNDVMIEYGRSSVPQGSFDSTAQGVLAAARQQPSDYEQLKYIHDWIINNTVYTNTDAEYEYEADGPVVYGRAVCEGYSKAFMYFAQSLGFECVCAIGFAGGVEHMWNMVKLGGQWYNVDATWDDPIMSDGSNTLRHKYFLISDRQIKQDHSFDTRFFSLPDAPNNYL